MKRLMTAVLFLALLLCCCAGAGAEEITQGDLIYTVSQESGKASIVDFNLALGQTQVIIPQKLGGYPVEFIAFDKLPESVKTVFATQDFSDSLYITHGKEMRVVVCAVDEAKKQVTIKEVTRVWGAGVLVRKEPSYVPLDDLPQAWKDYTVKADTFMAGDCVFAINQFTGWPVLQMCDLPEGAAEVVVPPELNSYLAIWLSGNAMEKNIRVIYLPKRARGYLTDIPVGREYCLIYYADYDMVMADEALRQQFGYMGESDFVLLECKMVYEGSEEDLSSGDQQEKQVWFAAEDMPQQVQGHKLHTDLVVSTNLADISNYHEIANRQGSTETEKLMNTTFSWGGMLYTVNPYDNTASIVGYDLAEGQTELFVPPDFDGYAVNEIEYEHIPTQIEKVWLHEDCGKMIWHYGEKPKNRELLEYTYAVEAQDSVLLTSVFKGYWDAAGSMTGKRLPIKADEAPGEIAGRKVTLLKTAGNFTNHSDVVYSSQGWEYYLRETYEEGDMVSLTARIANCPVPEDAEILFFPEELDGYPVDDIIDIEVIPESVKIVCMKGNGSTWGITGSADRTIALAHYTDWSGAADLRGGRPEDMQEDDLVWTRAMRRNLATEENSWSIDQMINAADLPGVINGHRVVFPKTSMDFYFDSGDWRYFRDADLITNDAGEIVRVESRAHLLNYLGEDNPENLFIPAQIDGLKVSGVQVAGLPDSVKTVYCNGQGYLGSSYMEWTGSLTCVTYEKFSSFIELNGRKSLPADANMHDLVWSYVSVETFEGETRTAVGGLIDAAALPREIDGQRVLVPYTPYFVYTSDGWEYTLGPYGAGDTVVAWITGSDLPEGITEMTVPEELDGYKVTNVGMAAIPQTVRTVYVPRGCHVRTEDEPTRIGPKILEKKK